MPLSVLSTPINEDTYMLVDTTTNTVIETGTEDNMYKLKDVLETEEQTKDNDRWMAQIFVDRLSIAKSLMKSDAAALNILKTKMPTYYQAWIKYKDVL